MNPETGVLERVSPSKRSSLENETTTSNEKRQLSGSAEPSPRSGRAHSRPRMEIIPTLGGSVRDDRILQSKRGEIPPVGPKNIKTSDLGRGRSPMNTPRTQLDTDRSSPASAVLPQSGQLADSLGSNTETRSGSRIRRSSPRKRNNPPKSAIPPDRPF